MSSAPSRMLAISAMVTGWRVMIAAQVTARPVSGGHPLLEHVPSIWNHLCRSDFAAVGRRRVKSRSGHYARALRRTHDAKAPGPPGCVRAGARFVAPLVRCSCIALRGAPGGSPRPHATQAVSIWEEHALTRVGNTVDGSVRLV